MVFNATFNNISVISWQSVLLVEKTTDLSQVTFLFCFRSVVSYFIHHHILSPNSDISFQVNEILD